MENWYTREIAMNPNTSPNILRKILEEGNEDNVSCYAAENPNCPVEFLKKIFDRDKNDLLSCSAADNEKCPPELLRKILKRGKSDHTSWNASENSNCPIDAKIKWKKAVGVELTDEDVGWIIKNTKAPFTLKIY